MWVNESEVHPTSSAHSEIYRCKGIIRLDHASFVLEMQGVHMQLNLISRKEASGCMDSESNAALAGGGNKSVNLKTSIWALEQIIPCIVTTPPPCSPATHTLPVIAKWIANGRQHF